MCNEAYGLSIARGSFAFSKGAWTHVSQTVVLNTPGVQDGNFLLGVDGRVVINRTDVLYRDKPRERDHIPFCDPNSQPDDGLLGPLLGGLFGPGRGSRRDRTEVLSPRAPLDSSTFPYDKSDAIAQSDSPVEPEPLGDDVDICVRSVEGTTTEADDPIGFKGVFFRYVPSGSLRDQNLDDFDFVPQYILWRAPLEVCHAEGPVCLVQRFCAIYQRSIA